MIGNLFSPARRFHNLPGKQKGAYTIFSAILVLILLTELILYAVQTGVFEQRKSANEMRQKEAFHLADSALQLGKEFMLANSIFVPSTEDDILPTGGDDGWLSASGPRWLPCEASLLTASEGTHPCYAEPADNASDFPADLRHNSYFYSFGTTDPTELPIDVGGLMASSTQDVSLHALLCMLDIDRDADPIVQGCTLDAAKQDTRYFLVTLLARGQADCNAGTCTATALVSEKIGSFGPANDDGSGAPPLITKSTFPPTGSAEIVPNPNAGGVGVPISAWMNTNTSCPNQVAVDPGGASWSCPTPNCACANNEKRLSWSDGGGDTNLGIDLVTDDAFPCDLFYYTFGVAKDAAGIDFVKYGVAKQVLSDCSSLNENSFGVYWVTGAECRVNSNTQIGSAKAPVFLISAASSTRFAGGASLFGTLFVTDAEDANASFNAVGTMTIYGAAIVDAELAQYQGTFQIVYLDSVLDKSLQSGGFGAVAGGWTDFHQDWR
jgi:hypothetical protein